MMPTPEITPIPLSHFTRRIANAIDLAGNLTDVWVTAEITDLVERGGHIYMQLIEKDETHPSKTMTAKLRANIWMFNRGRVFNNFFKNGGTNLTNGIKVNAKGSASHHSVYGLSFNITDLRPFLDEGEREKKRREIIERLRKENIIDGNLQHIIPIAPQRIAVISSETAAGYLDFMTHISGNPYKFVFYTRLYDSIMQGDKTASSVISALKKIRSNFSNWDCVVIIRGGGATVDMDGFDDYELAKEICTFPLPVVVGIGHEKDRNVLDEVANVSCKTPTAVADFLIGQMSDAMNSANNLVARITKRASDMLEGEKIRISQLDVRLPNLVKSILDRHHHRLDRLESLFPMAVTGRTAKERGRIEALGSMIVSAAPSLLTRQKERLVSLENLLNVLSPSNTLKRGYAIARKGGKAIRSNSEAKVGDELEIQVFEGIISVNVK